MWHPNLKQQENNGKIISFYIISKNAPFEIYIYAKKYCASTNQKYLDLVQNQDCFFQKLSHYDVEHKDKSADDCTDKDWRMMKNWFLGGR